MWCVLGVGICESFWLTENLLEVMLPSRRKVLEIILAVWQAPRNDFGCLVSSCESFQLSGKLLRVILAVWGTPGSHLRCLGTFWELFWLSRQRLGVILAVWEASED